MKRENTGDEHDGCQTQRQEEASCCWQILPCRTLVLQPRPGLQSDLIGAWQLVQVLPCRPGDPDESDRGREGVCLCVQGGREERQATEGQDQDNFTWWKKLPRPSLRFGASELYTPQLDPLGNFDCG